MMPSLSGDPDELADGELADDEPDDDLDVADGDAAGAAAGAAADAAGAAGVALGDEERGADVDGEASGAMRSLVSCPGAGLLSASVPIAKPTARQRSMLSSAAKKAKSFVRHESRSP